MENFKEIAREIAMKMASLGVSAKQILIEVPNQFVMSQVNEELKQEFGSGTVYTLKNEFTTMNSLSVEIYGILFKFIEKEKHGK